MRRRNGKGAAKTRRRKPTKPRLLRATVSRRRPSVGRPKKRDQQLRRELEEALEQQAATSEILKLISSSAGELQPVFEAILNKATRICQAGFGTLNLYDGSAYRTVALQNPPPQFATRLGIVIRPHPDSGLAHVARTKTIAHIDDIRTRRPYLEGNKAVVELADLAGARTLLITPMLKDERLVGAISIYRQEVRPFTDRQIELVKNFASQAVIAIENARLLSELRQRTDDLTDSLEQQTATSEVLQVISKSPGELEPVFEAMLGNAVRICGAKFGNMWLREGDGFRIGATYGTPRAYVEFIHNQGVFHPDPRVGLGAVIRTKQPFQFEDAAAAPTYGDKPRQALIDLGGARTLIGVPMLKDDKVIGAIGIYRQEVRPFTNKQIDLVKNFASQAVIAIENTRLLSELRESLQQQTATADVLKVISRSTFNLQGVLETLTESAARLCEAEMAAIAREKDSAFYYATSWGFPADYLEFVRNVAHPVNRKSVIGRTLTEGKPVQIADVLADPDYGYLESQKKGGFRTLLGVPLVREGTPIGVLLLGRSTVRPFTDKQIDLVTTFADQAVIAIENVRLFDEVQARTRELSESLQQQTATADVLKVISRSTFDLQTVLDTLVKSAAGLCEADQSFLYRLEGENYIWAASHGYSEEFVKLRKSKPLVPDRGTGVGRAIVESKIVHIPDVLEDKEYTAWDLQHVAGYRAVLGVPLLREGRSMGVFSLARSAPRSFTPKQIELLTMFADQAAIAMENVRLFESVEARTRELAKSLEDLRTTQDRLVQTQKLASLGQLTAGIAHEIKNPLNFVNNFSVVSAELIDELHEALEDTTLPEKRQNEIAELMETLRGNLEKVVQHSKRADGIVKNMLLHSREGSGEHRTVDINALVEESLNLAYHGARAEKQGFNITLQRSFDATAGEADIFPQEITRVLLNLISNGFYAATKRRTQTADGGYEPTLSASTKSLGDRVEIGIRDNGMGIPSDVKEKMFNPFFTTKPAGEGTGLGLSISHDIVVKQHGGSIEVSSQPGEFTEIRIILPRAGVAGQT